MKIFDCLAAFIQDKMWGEDDIDDVLEKLKFEDALKEIHHNQEKLLQNQTGTQQSLTAIDELLNKRLQKRQEALQIAAFSSVSTRPSPRSSMTPVSMDSTPIIVSCTSTPVITPPSSQSISLPCSNRSNSHGVDKNPCFSLDDRNDLTSFNARNNEDTPIESTPSSFATQIEPTFCDFTAGPSSSSSSSVHMEENTSSCSLGEPSNHSNPPNLLNEGNTPLASYNGPISRDLINFAAANSTNCKGFVFKLMDGMFNKKELASSSLVGGVRKYRGSTYTKQALSPGRMKNIFKAAKLRFPTEFARVANSPEFRDAINMKCRKTVFKDQ